MQPLSEASFGFRPQDGIFGEHKRLIGRYTLLLADCLTDRLEELLILLEELGSCSEEEYRLPDSHSVINHSPQSYQSPHLLFPPLHRSAS